MHDMVRAPLLPRGKPILGSSVARGCYYNTDFQPEKAMRAHRRGVARDIAVKYLRMFVFRRPAR